MPTLKEFYGDKVRGDGRRFRRYDWPLDRYFEPIFLDSASAFWHGLRDSGIANLISEVSPNDWQEWTPPKQKVIRWKWAYAVSDTSPWVEKETFYSETEVREIPWYVTCKWQKLEYTATEFDE